MPKLWQDVKDGWREPANWITTVRLACSWVAAYLHLTSHGDTTTMWYSALAFALVVATDFVDGMVARRDNGAGVTNLGKLMDPFVDKVVVILTSIAVCFTNPWAIPQTLVTITREVSVTRTRMRARARGITLAAIESGKHKMTAQCVAVVMLLAPLPVWLMPLRWMAVGVAVALTVTSWIDFNRNAKQSVEA